jgi:2-polyprenyl-6-methoxyphenol hydroxylase-like FAD-dependent oxidoreductase
MKPLDAVKGRYDALVVGARCAGAATAMLLARRGLRVLAVDRGGYGADTLSTHALMRAGVLQLARWGLLGQIEAAGTPPVPRTVFHYEDEVVDIPIKPRDGVPALFAPRRFLLDRVLVDAARAAGATVVHHVRPGDLVRSAGGRVEGALLTDEDGRTRLVRAGIVIGADGLRSTVASLVGAPVTRVGRHAAVNVFGYWSGLEVDGYHWHWRPGVAAGAIPTNDGQVCVFVSMPPIRFFEEIRGDVLAGYRRALGQAAPELAERLQEGRLVGTLHGFPGQPGFLRRPWGPGWALVGDAGYFKDPITAHGISDALRDAELLARAVEWGGAQALAEYEASRDALSERLFDVTDAIASFEWDTAALKELHLGLSDEMKREVAELVPLGQGFESPLSAGPSPTRLDSSSASRAAWPRASLLKEAKASCPEALQARRSSATARRASRP